MESHRACELCGVYTCDPNYFAEKHNAICTGCGERFCGPYRQKGHTGCPCGALSCVEGYDPAEHAECACGVYACKDPLFEINHKACEGCGVKICDRAYGRHSHKLCSGCGMRKCNPEYDADAHDKCNGCRELLCVSENDHTHCVRCNRYVCKASDNYYDHDHSVNWWGKPLCLDFIEEEEEEEPEQEQEPEPPEQEQERCTYCGEPGDTHSYCNICDECDPDNTHGTPTSYVAEDGWEVILCNNDAHCILDGKEHYRCVYCLDHVCNGKPHGRVGCL